MTQESTQKRRKNTSKTTRMIIKLLFVTFIAAVANGFAVSNLLGSTLIPCRSDSECPDGHSGLFGGFSRFPVCSPS